MASRSQESAAAANGSSLLLEAIDWQQFGLLSHALKLHAQQLPSPLRALRFGSQNIQVLSPRFPLPFQVE
jgi:hypothetical protein